MRLARWLLVIALAGCGTAGHTSTDSVTVGALLPLTGSLASYGESSRAVLLEAVATINGRGGPRLALVIEDTKTDPAAALAALQRLGGRGIKLVIGPYASSEVRAAKGFADEHGVILISPLSTARSLAIPDDNVFRFMPDDEQEAAAVAALVIADGVRVIIPVTRDDEGNKGLQTAFKPAFEKRGGRVLDGVTYRANERDFSGTARILLRNLARAQQANPGAVGVYLTAFDEVVALFNQIVAAGGGPAGVKWYGSDSVAQSKELVANATAAAFAMRAGYPNPVLGLDDRSRRTWGPIAERVAVKLGRPPDAFAPAAYDALMVGYAALLKAGDGAGVAALRQEVTASASTHDGLTGRTTLNAAGDRASGDYDFWAVCRVGSVLAWGKAAIYTAGEARRVSGCDQQPR